MLIVGWVPLIFCCGAKCATGRESKKDRRTAEQWCRLKTIWQSEDMANRLCCRMVFFVGKGNYDITEDELVGGFVPKSSKQGGSQRNAS